MNENFENVGFDFCNLKLRGLNGRFEMFLFKKEFIVLKRIFIA
jgi:hypothetical protein